MTGSLASPEAADGKPRLFTPRPPGHPGTRQDGSHYASFLRDSTGPEPGPQLPPGSYLQNGASKRKLPPLGAQPTQTQAAGGSKAPGSTALPGTCRASMCPSMCDLLNHRAPDPHLSQAWPQLLGGPPLVSAPTVGHHCVPGVSLLQIWAPSWRPQPTPPHPPWGLAGARSQLLPPCPGPSCQVSPHMGQRPS